LIYKIFHNTRDMLELCWTSFYVRIIADRETGLKGKISRAASSLSASTCTCRKVPGHWCVPVVEAGGALSIAVDKTRPVTAGAGDLSYAKGIVDTRAGVIKKPSRRNGN